MTKVGGDSIKSGVPTGLPQNPAETQSGQENKAPSPARTIKVEISSASAGAHQLDKLLAGVAVVDTAAVESAKQAILEGRFRVDAEVVARKLLATVREHLVIQQKA